MLPRETGVYGIVPQVFLYNAKECFAAIGDRLPPGSFSGPHGPPPDIGPRTRSWTPLWIPHESPDAARWPGSRIKSPGKLMIQYEITAPALIPAPGSGTPPEVSDVPHRTPHVSRIGTRIELRTPCEFPGWYPAWYHV